ncbi:concanavalin A-like lectin/glucanase [Aureobasidium melanogenum CBS 110374]|uniref:Crh-like protein n=1 Tax=Aureobasidium melanogenum (strain CBS 110374) TaxID=1043003 RepID=A0A074VWH7_AURM1|nr:concanavalin A-like lectin/glucanase [Aureobasidium melanogenum CBS 110374]KEQ64828.1 concanavalin A-like lectin/glucanase [Aureobasidium melanogenum CBS 110374]
MHFIRNSALAGLAVIPFAFAQTYTTCNPLDKTCPNDTGLDSASFACDFTKGKSALASWSAATGTALTYDGTKGAQFVISGKNQAPTISSDFYIFFGRVDVTMQAAPGVGIVSSMVLESDDLDEIDWEWLGGDGTQAQTNYFGKGNTTSYDRGTYQSVSSPQTIMHTYSFDWTEEKIDWLIDGVIVRTLMYADAVGGKNFPQTPMRLKLGNWVAGDPATNAPGTIEWAGGDTDFSQAPFTMYVKTVSITNYNPAKEYEYTDKTGSYESIKLVDGSSGSSSSSASGSSSSSSKTATQLKSTAVISNSMNTSVISSVSASATSAAASASASASKSSSHSSSASASATSSQPAQQSTNAGVSNTVATGLFSVVGAAAAFFIL